MAERKIFPLSDQQQGNVLVATDLVDEMLGRYISWREDAAEAADTYRRWCTARRAEEHWRFAAYLAALDLEESSAASYAHAVADVERAVQRNR